MFYLSEMSLHSWFIQIPDWRWQADDSIPTALLEALNSDLSLEVDSLAASAPTGVEPAVGETATAPGMPPAWPSLPVQWVQVHSATLVPETETAAAMATAPPSTVKPHAAPTPATPPGRWVLAGTRTLWFTSYHTNPAASLQRQTEQDDLAAADRLSSLHRLRTGRLAAPSQSADSADAPCPSAFARPAD